MDMGKWDNNVTYTGWATPENAAAVKGWWDNINLVDQKVDPSTYQAQLSDYQAQQAKLNESNYANAIQQAQGGFFGAGQMSNQTAAQQAALAQALQDQAAGKGPSLAQMQLKQATQQNAQSAAGQIASQRGLNPALAARMVGQNTASMNQQAAGQSSMARLQEQMAAREQLGGLLGTQRSQDIAQMQANTGMFGSAGGLQNAQNQNRISNMGMMQNINSQTAMQNAQMQNQASQYNADAQNQAKYWNAKGQMDNYGKILQGAGQAVGALFGAYNGGVVPSYKDGGLIPGTPAVPYDSPKNDTVLAKLSPGEIVIPQSIADDPEKSKAFIDAVQSGQEENKAPDYGQVLNAIRELQNKVQQLQGYNRGGRINK
jgi:hypothetical protein